MAEQSVRFTDEGDRGRDLAAELRSAARVLRQQWWLVVLGTLVGALAAYAYTTTESSEYESTARLLLLQSDPNAGVLETGVPFTDPARERATDIELVQQPPVAKRVVKRLGRDLDLSAGQALAMISTSVQGDSNVLSITATSDDPSLTGPLANAFGVEFIRFERQTQRRRYRKATGLVQSRIRSGVGGAELRRLREQASQLRLLSSLQTGDAQFIEGAANPGAEVSSGVARRTALGALLGLLLGLSLAFLRDRLDPRLKTEEQLTALLPGIPVIASVPRIKPSPAGRRAVAERYHLLQADLEAIVGSGGAAPFLLVTSAMPDEGKSSTAANLALAINERGGPVTLVEADIRRPELSRLAGSTGPGLASILRGEVSLDQALTTTGFRLSDNGGPSVVIDGQVPFIPAGRMDSDHHQLLSGAGLERLLTELASRESAVVIDGPPLGLFSDMSRLSRLVDQVVIVVRPGHTRRRALRGLVDQLARAGVVPAGVVITGAPVDISQYGNYSS